MIRRNLSFILIIIAMVISVLNYDFANTSVGSRPFWLFIGALGILVAAAILILYNEARNRKNKSASSEE